MSSRGSKSPPAENHCAGKHANQLSACGFVVGSLWRTPLRMASLVGGEWTAPLAVLTALPTHSLPAPVCEEPMRSRPWCVPGRTGKLSLPLGQKPRTASFQCHSPTATFQGQHLNTLTCRPRSSVAFSFSSSIGACHHPTGRTTSTVTKGEMSPNNPKLEVTTWGAAQCAMRGRCLCWAKGGSCQVSQEGLQEC